VYWVFVEDDGYYNILLQSEELLQKEQALLPSSSQTLVRKEKLFFFFLHFEPLNPKPKFGHCTNQFMAAPAHGLLYKTPCQRSSSNKSCCLLHRKMEIRRVYYSKEL
jgi:hypothetical protein